MASDMLNYFKLALLNDGLLHEKDIFIVVQNNSHIIKV